MMLAALTRAGAASSEAQAARAFAEGQRAARVEPSPAAGRTVEERDAK